MSFHIGKLIKEEIHKKGWSLKKFSEEANMTYRNVMYIFERTDISIELLKQISKVLDFDFVSLYLTKEPPLVIEEASSFYKKTNNVPIITYQFVIPPEAYGDILEFQERIKALSEEYGLVMLE
ncbi:helix-turn-helix domain-containing protein [Pedobacter sp. MW01-1-1]|uniref:helix-turn-helix domain-containing protein n=1 Tax=Pedobacter sp. MW01-1-1 TaxID=3383027 RepID=UPI003FF03172